MRKAICATACLKSLIAAIVLASPALALEPVSGGVVKIGVLTDLSGVYADLTGKTSVVGAQMAAEDFGGKVLGRPIEVIAADHQNNPDVGVGIARRWYDLENVDAIVDVPNSSIALAVQKLTTDKNRVFLIAGGGVTDLTGKACSPNGIQWIYDTYELPHIAAQEIVKGSNKKWFFITADYAFGHSLEAQAAAEVVKYGGTVAGAVRHPLNNSDFSSYLLQAQASKADVVAFADAGADLTNAVKQAYEFGIPKGGQKLVGLLTTIYDIHALGLEQSNGMRFTINFYWDRDDETRTFNKRFLAKAGGTKPAGDSAAGVYSAVRHYLRAIEAAGTDEPRAVLAKMREMPINDVFAKDGWIRDDGRMMHAGYLARVKTPAESEGGWDLLTLEKTVPAEEAFRPLSESECPLVRKK
jgi:branched-chain amino acid transport system substrate-binding protein